MKVKELKNILNDFNDETFVEFAFKSREIDFNDYVDFIGVDNREKLEINEIIINLGILK